MESNQELYSELKNFILTRGVKKYEEDEHWKDVAKGIIILYKYRDEYGKEKLMSEFYRLRKELDSMKVSDSIDDFVDDLEAILIHWWMHAPDFWTTSFEDFKTHWGHKDSFE